MLIAGLGGLVVGLLLRSRLLPSLVGDSMMNHGKQVSTAEFASSTAWFFFVFAGVCIVGSVIWTLMLTRKK